MRCKLKGWISVGLLLAVLTVTATGLAQVATTQVADTIYYADGTVAAGTLVISWPAFTTSSGERFLLEPPPRRLGPAER